MIRKASPIAVLALLLVAAAVSAAPIRLARTPDYRAGKIAFSYLGDIWVVNEDGSNPQRITINTAREVNPRFSPDGRWIAFSSNRYGNYDVFIVPAAGGTPKRLTYHTGNDEAVSWTPDSKYVVFRASHGDGAFPGTATLYQISVDGGQETPLPVDWGWWGSYSPDGKNFLFNRHPAVWSRKHYRGSYAADIWIEDLATKAYRQILPGENYNRYWPMWGPKDDIYFVGDPLPNDKTVKPGSVEVRKSLNNIYKISAKGGAEPIQVTKHTDGNVFFPSMSSDGKVVVYEENFGIWKLDVASGKTSEVKIDIATDEKENQFEVVTISSEADSFDLSPSGRRAVISSQNQIFTIATDRGDITLIANDNGSSRNESPKWSPDGKYISFISDRSGRQEIYLTDEMGKNLKKITDLDTDKSSVTWTPDSSGLIFGSSDNKLYFYSVADGKTSAITSNTIAQPRLGALSPDGKWVLVMKQDRTMRNHAYIVPLTGGEERRITEDSASFSESSGVWTADGRFIVYITSTGTGGGVASTGGGAANQVQLMVLPLRALDRDPLNRDVDNEAQAQAADAAGGRGGGQGARGGGAAAGTGASAQPVEVRIDWDGLTKRARRLTTPGDTVGGLTPAPSGSIIAFTSATAGGAGRGAAPAAGESTSGIYTINVADGSGLTRVPPAAPSTAAAGRGGRGGGGGGFGGGGGMAFTRDGRTLYFRSGSSIYAASIGGGGVAAAAAPAATTAGRGGGGRGGAAAPAATAPTTTAATARQVTFTITTTIDHKALRKEVFDEGWRVMKNRFYDAKMHGADWNAAKATYGALLDYIVDEDELHTVMMQMIGELNASHTGVSGGPAGGRGGAAAQTRHPGFELEPDSSGYYRVGYIWKDGPVDHEYAKIHKGNYIISVDDHELKTTENYWQYFTLAAGRKFHFLINDKPSRDGAWELTIEPMNSGALSNAQYARWVEERRVMVDKLSNGEIGYLHIKAMDAPSLRQFQLDLVLNRTKKALIIDQRFNGGGGIDQELLGMLVGQRYQYSVGRNSDLEVPRPLETFYGPMAVMQNERSASDAEMFPQGFKDLKLGKVVGVPTMAAVIATGSFTLADGSSIRTPGAGVWTASGQNMENFGVKPDVYVDNTPEDFIKGRDAQIEKAVEVLKTEIAAGKKKDN
jgi:tricorn protease